MKYFIIIYSFLVVSTVNSGFCGSSFPETSAVNVHADTNYFMLKIGDFPPECINLVEVRSTMVYPDSARDAGIEGRVVIKLLVDTSGSVEKTGKITGPEIFYNEVRTKAMALKFIPGVHNGEKVKVWVSVPFNFKLEK